MFLQFTIIVEAQNLDYFIQKGIQNSPLIRDYNNELQSSILDSLLILASQKPQIDANAQIYYAPFYRNFGYDEAITNGGTYSSLVGISQSFLNRKILENKYNSIAIQKMSVYNSSKISISELKRVITNQYLTAYADFSDLSFNKSFLNLMNEEKEIVKQLVENGIYKQTDFLSLSIEIQNQEIQVEQIETQQIKDIYLLQQICGIKDSDHINLSFPSIDKQSLSNPSLSPLFVQFKIDSLKVANEKINIDIRYLPKLNWFANAGIMGSEPANLYHHFGYSAGINFTVPIYDWHQRKINYQKLDYTENTRYHYEQFYRNQYYQQVQQLNSELVSEQKLDFKLKLQLITAEELISLSKAQLNSGNIPVVDFINTLKNYINIRRNLNQIKVKQLQTINELNYLMQQ